jgi:uncharacterized protein
MKKFLFVIFIFLSLIIIVVIYKNLLVSKVKSSRIIIGNKVFSVEIADTDSKRSQGLSGRMNLDKDKGMLFTFPKPDRYYFWMKDMNFSLDFVWINRNEIIDLTENVQVPFKNAIDFPAITSKTETDMVLEINSGMINQKHIKIGDRVKIE